MSLTNSKNNNNFEKIDKINQRVDLEKLLEVSELVSKIVINIKNNGDKAVAEYSKNFDNYDVDLVDANPFSVKEELSLDELGPELKAALKLAQSRIEEFHKHDLKHFNNKDWLFTGSHNEKLGAKVTALDSVAVYIPGGQAALVSTLLMTVIPAQIAGVKRIAVFSPPEIDKSIIALAQHLGIKEIYAIGGAQAVAAAAFGTQSIEKFDKVVGPGNIFVSEAKKMLNGIIGIDGIYGPSELAILCDDTAKLEKLAIDLLSQLEHGSGLESTLAVTTSKEIAEKLEAQLYAEVEKINYTEKQKETIHSSIKNWSAIIYEANIDDAIKLINYYAPEHLELQLNAENLAKAKVQITNAGAIFIGENSCESLGDYLAGPSHCLPTAGSAKFSSGLQVSDFYKKTSIIDFSNSDQINDLLEATAQIARVEGLEAHAKAAQYRIK